MKKSTLKYTDAGYSTFAAGTTCTSAMLYAAANDGMLHAFDATTGDEVWAFVPSYVMPNLYRLADNDYGDNHQYYVDGSPVVADIYTGGAWKTILVGGLNAGGKGYYALDITDPDNPVGAVGVHRRQHGADLRQPGDHQAGQRHVGGGSSPRATTTSTGVGRATSTWSTRAPARYASTGGALSDGHRRRRLHSRAAWPRSTAWVDNARTTTTPPSASTAATCYGNLWRFDVNCPFGTAGVEAQAGHVPHGGTSPQPITTKPQLTVCGQWWHQGVRDRWSAPGATWAAAT